MPNKKEHKDNHIIGMGAALAAFFMFAIMQTFAKILSETHHVIEIAFYRNIIGVIPFLVLIYIMGRKEILKINTQPKTIVLRSSLGTVSLVVTLAAFAAMPMADATAFLFTSSLFILILSIIFLSEKAGMPRYSAIIIGFIGVMIMLSPSGNVNITGAFLALSAAVMHAILQIILRILGKSEKPETVTFYFVLIGTFITIIPLPFIFTMPTLQDLPLILGLGLSGVIAQLLISTAYKNAPASLVTTFNYSGIIWATLFGWIIWQDWPSYTIWIGGAIVIASNIFILWRETRLKKEITRESLE